MPTPPSRERLGRLLVGLLVAAAAGCTTSPAIGAGTVAAAKARIVAEVNATGAQIGAPARFTPLTTAALLPCDQRMLGYTIKHLAARRAEAPAPISFTGGPDGASLLGRVERYWKSRGYAIDRSGLSDHRYPKLRTHIGPDLLVATGYVGLPQINIYGVTDCVNR